MRTEHIKVGDMSFVMSEASANDQLELMTLLSAQASFVIASSGVDVVDANLVVGILTRCDKSKMDHIARLVLDKTREEGKPELPVDVKTFQGKIMSYYLLIAEAVKFNLDDFFTYALNDAKAAREKGETNQTTA